MLPIFITNPDPKIYNGSNWFSFDFETTNFSKGDAGDIRNRIVYGYGLSAKFGAIHFSDLSDIFSLLEKSDFIICHGGKFELKWLIRMGYPVEKLLLYDTLLGDYARSGNRGWLLDLDSVSQRYGGKGKNKLVSNLIHGGVCPSEIPKSLLQEYCQQDVTETIFIFHIQQPLIAKEGLNKVHYLRCLTAPVLADMEMNGLHLDKKLVEKVYGEYSAEYRIVSDKLTKITGGINMASAPQVARFLYENLGFEEKKVRGKPVRNKSNTQFPGGQPLTDIDTILELKATTKEQKEFVELRIKESEIRKKIGTYCELYMDACGLTYYPLKKTKKKYSHVRGSCVIRGKLNQSISSTQRLTSSDPNLQNIDCKLKMVVTPRKYGWKMINADFRTLEMSMAGQLAQDQQVYNDIINDRDFHSYTASIILREAWEKAGSSRSTVAGERVRTEAKPETFRPLYGATKGTKRQLDYYTEFRDRYEVTYVTQQSWVNQVLREKELTLVTGLKFYWLDTEMQQSGYIKNQNMIFNYPVQNFSFEVASMGVVILWHNLKQENKKSFLVNFVHDSALIESPKEEVVEVKNLMVRCLSKCVVPLFDKLFNYKLNFPLGVDVVAHDHWGSNLDND